ncbi:PA0069 family radical SAM protein [Calycomorphotria hydatis]|uniref:Radical SAM superfamily protein n=1 Tax=Calycomorphotria hydatis TaxID=2528027 RepID=A0A517TCF7_9PLAN|nr:PA0069 family radical SAM protein [Calycomorphotria hydatis]QDT66064.1 Radical SAM superfamily protein [Calycomorphotria hydatis]
MSKDQPPKGSLPAKGRGSAIRPHNRFDKITQHEDWEHIADDEEYLLQLGRPKTEFLTDTSRTIVSENNSPDIPFRYSINPYRGCEHGCSYCYARPYHEYLGHDAGLDFETKIYVKYQAPELFRDWLARKNYEPEVIAMSGVTDCFQPCERKFQLTRQCLAVAEECGQPISIVTKNALVCRDLDLLASMAEKNLIHVAISLTTLDDQLARGMEPRTSSPQARLRAIRELTAAGVPTRVMVAPVIPGLNDPEIPALLEAASEAGAIHAAMTVLRLPLSVLPVFREWLHREHPNAAGKVEDLIQIARGGRWNDSRFGERMRGEGNRIAQIQQTFHVFARRYQLDGLLPPYDFSNFKPPLRPGDQQVLF